MKKLCLLFVLFLLLISCSKKVEIRCKIINASPLARIEIIDASSTASLPLLNLGLDKKGEFLGSFEASKDGIYALSYNGEIAFIYIEKGQNINISGDATLFPSTITITGDAKANNDFIKSFDQQYETFVSKINFSTVIEKTEKNFINDVEKTYAELEQILEKEAQKLGASESVIRYKKDDIQVKIAGLITAYTEYNTKINPTFIATKNLKQLSEKLLNYKDRKVKTLPLYRQYLLHNISTDFEKFISKEGNHNISEVFAKFLKTQKDLSQTEKDYLYGYVLAQTEINPNNIANYDKVSQWINNNISNKEVKQDLKTLQIALMGNKVGITPHLTLISKEGKKVQLGTSNKQPTLVTFYASWNPNINITAFPFLKEVTKLYKDKTRFVYINLDDDKAQFEKTSKAMLKDFKGESFWVKGGINAEAIKKIGIYSFRMPSYLILDKNGKIYSKPFFNLNDPEFVVTMNRLTSQNVKLPEPLTTDNIVIDSVIVAP